MDLSTLILSIIAIIMIIIVVNAFKSKFNQNKTEDTVQTKVEPVHEDLSLKSIDSLLATETFLAVNGPEYVRTLTKPLFDGLYEIIEVLNDDYVGLSFELNNMAQEIIPNRIKAFVKVEDNIDVFKSDIATMLKVVTDVRDIIRNDNISKNEREALLIQIKY